MGRYIVRRLLWVIFVLLTTWLGILVYLIARGSGMTKRSIAQAQAQQAQFDSYVKQTAAAADPADQISKLAQLREQGALTDAEFDAQKAKILA